MKLAHRPLLAALLGMAALHAQASPYYASKDGRMIWDQATGLVWARCSLGQKWNGKACALQISMHNFEAAQAVAKRFNAAGGLGGFTDWVVPKIRQLLTLRACSTRLVGMKDLKDGGIPVPQECLGGNVAPSIDPNAFPQTDVTVFWSSSFYKDQIAWGIFFGEGILGGFKYGEEGAVRLVRASELSGDEAAVGFPTQLPEMTQADWDRIAQAENALREAALARSHAEDNARLQKTLAVGAKGLYLQARQNQRKGHISEATDFYNLIIRHFPEDPLALKAADQLTVMQKSEKSAR